MNKKRIALLIIATLAFSAFPITLFSFVGAKPKFVLPDYEQMDFNPEGNSINLNMEIKGDADLQTSSSQKSAEVGDVVGWIWYDDTTGILYLKDYQLVAQGVHCEVWVMLELDFPEGDPRDPVIVTQEQCEYIVDEFDNNIYPIETEYFGEENLHRGNKAKLSKDFFDGDGRTAILVSNIGDANYYDPDYPSYIAGFYWGSVFEHWCDRNVISIDAYDWAHRCGTVENTWFENDDKARPNLYESIVAHEFQHLIHDDWFELSETWMNEACSLFAEPLCGYELDLGQVEWFLETPDNSLTVWGDQGGINILADYGAAFLWALYLTDHYGIGILGDYVEQGIAGIEGVNLLLPEGVVFQDVFHDWRIANLIDAELGKYGYQLDELRELYNPHAVLDLDEVYSLHVHEVYGEEIPWTSAVNAFGETITHESSSKPEGWETGAYFVGPFGTEYISFPDLEGLNFIEFDGDDEAIYGWTKTDGLWYSGYNNLLDALLVTAPYTVNTGDILTLNTYWDIEEIWDFGFVQVSTDGGNTWTSLENEYTIYDYDSGAHPDIIANLPGLTGCSDIFMDINFDLSDYVGEEVIFGFRYMTDWAVLNDGWYISSVTVDDIPLTETLTPVYPKPEFQVTVVEKVICGGQERYFVYDMYISALDNTGFTLAYSRPSNGEIILIISPVQLNGFTDYQFKTQQISMSP